MRHFLPQISKKTALSAAIGGAFLGFILLSVSGPGNRALTNLWLLGVGNGYFIPEGSSIFTFQPTVLNDGSGEWWLYGEDAEYFYALDPKDGMQALSIKKADSVRCPLFDEQKFETWCDADALAR